jgi:hypothetical protein
VKNHEPSDGMEIAEFIDGFLTGILFQGWVLWMWLEANDDPAFHTGFKAAVFLQFVFIDITLLVITIIALILIRAGTWFPWLMLVCFLGGCFYFACFIKEVKDDEM